MPQKVPISTVKPNPNNPRIIKDDKFKKLVQSLLDFPDMERVRPIVVNKDMVILGGNMRYKAAIQAGWTDIFIEIVDWDEEKQREFIIKDNISGGEWDWNVIANEWDTDLLTDWGLDIKWVSKDVEEDEPPDVSPDPAVSKSGEIYKLGRHRIMCGDATDTQSVAKLMDGQMADLLLTDPPYNVEYVGKTKDALTIQNDKQTDSNFRQFLVDSFTAAKMYMKAGACFYIWHADSEGFNFRGACHDVGWKVRQCLVWNKNSMVMGRQDYHWKHEPCLYGWSEGSHQWTGDRKQTTILDFDRPTKSKEHPTMKPVNLMSYNGL